MHNCPLCKINITLDNWFRDTANDSMEFDCPRCGNIAITNSLRASPSFENDDIKNKILVSGVCRRRQENGGERFELNTFNYNEIIENNRFSNALELIDNIILYLGSTLNSPGSYINIDYRKNFPVFGASCSDDIRFTIREMKNEKLIDLPSNTVHNCSANLTYKGWKSYGEISKKHKDSKIVFMAMQFNGDHLDEVFRAYELAVRQTGFRLNRLDKEPKAGMILNHMRVAIQKSKFVIADITYKNNGAYWEAGYAEGLGKNVIYSCSTNRKAEDMHFDVNQLQTVFWDHSNLKESAEALKLIIRSTFSREAILED